MLHQLKIERRYYDRIREGLKTFEIRKNDRDYQVNDEIEFQILSVKISNLPPTVTFPTTVYSPKIEFTSTIKYKIVYVHSGYGMDKDFVVLGIKEV